MYVDVVVSDVVSGQSAESAAASSVDDSEEEEEHDYTNIKIDSEAVGLTVQENDRRINVVHAQRDGLHMQQVIFDIGNDIKRLKVDCVIHASLEYSKPRFYTIYTVSLLFLNLLSCYIETTIAVECVEKCPTKKQIPVINNNFTRFTASVRRKPVHEDRCY